MKLNSLAQSAPPFGALRTRLVHLGMAALTAITLCAATIAPARSATTPPITEIFDTSGPLFQTTDQQYGTVSGTFAVTLGNTVIPANSLIVVGEFGLSDNEAGGISDSLTDPVVGSCGSNAGDGQYCRLTAFRNSTQIKSSTPYTIKTSNAMEKGETLEVIVFTGLGANADGRDSVSGGGGPCSATKQLQALETWVEFQPEVMVSVVGAEVLPTAGNPDPYDDPYTVGKYPAATSSTNWIVPKSASNIGNGGGLAYFYPPASVPYRSYWGCLFDTDEYITSYVGCTGAFAVAS